MRRTVNVQVRDGFRQLGRTLQAGGQGFLAPLRRSSRSLPISAIGPLIFIARPFGAVPAAYPIALRLHRIAWSSASAHRRPGRPGRRRSPVAAYRHPAETANSASDYRIGGIGQRSMALHLA